MFTHYRTQGIILQKQGRGEADRLLTIYTKDFGKTEVLAKAVRKISSKLRSSTELFYLSEVEFIQGKAYKTLTDAILIDRFALIRDDLSKLRVAHKIAEDFDNFVKAPERDPKIWQLLNEAFTKLNNWKAVNSLEIIYHFFFWNFVSLLGYQPKISGCSIQDKKVDCDIVKIIKVILRKDWQLLSRLKLNPAHFKLLKKVSEWYRVKIQV